MGLSKHGSVEVGSAAKKGEGRVRRYAATADDFTTQPYPDVKVVADILKRSVKEFPDRKAVGWRDTIRMVEEEKDVKKMVDGKETTEKKKWFYFELSDYHYWTYKELYEKVNQAGSALIETGHSRDTIFNIYAATSPRWQVMANGCAAQGITFATAYDSLGEEGLEHSLAEPEVYGMFTNANLLGTLAAVIAKTPSVKVVIYDGAEKDIKKGALETIKNAKQGVRVLTFDDFLALGQKNPREPNSPQPDDVATIMYTSGSTGAPKGVMLTNGNIVATISGVITMLGELITPDASYIAYLPLAHILEFTVELTMLTVGIPQGYATVKTLTDASVRNCAGDIRTFKPSIMVGVPAVWELIRKGIVAKVNSGGKITKKVFGAAMWSKQHLPTPVGWLMDAVVFEAVRNGTGGRLKYGISGGAPISHATQTFIATALVPHLIQGWGMTESSALSCVHPPGFDATGIVGFPVPSCEMKLVDFEEASYFSTNHPPQGEVWIRGPAVAKGYFKREDLTKEAFTDDGWLKTGDIGQWNPNGTLSIIDRKKNLVKLAGGEYIALERLESIYKSCEYVSNICLHADSNANKPMALIFPNEKTLHELASKNGIDSGKHSDLKELCDNKEIQKAVLAELNAVGKKGGLKGMETLQAVIMTPEEWTPQNGLLTAAQKLQRKAIMNKYEKEVKAVYPGA